MKTNGHRSPKAGTGETARRNGAGQDVTSIHSAPLGDFIISWRVVFISSLALVVGILSAFVALVLLRLIGLFTNLFYFGRLDTSLVSPAGNSLGVFALLVPVAGGLIVGLMARFGSDKIRGHGIPEAIEAVLLNGSRVQPRVALLKPLGSAIAIGTGGPFGAEGPIIMTGGAFGSLIAQFIHLTSGERKTLLAAGAAAGMSATFASPVSAVILAVELLLFEWRPRSLIPVSIASAAAAAMRPLLIGPGPLFPVTGVPGSLGVAPLLGCALVGLVAGLASVVLTNGVYAAEDLFHRLPIHWMWWPILGGVVVGLGGLIFPQALGVGYSTIGQIVAGNATTTVIVGVLVVKSIIWIAALSSGTSGGVLAPLLMIGGALGGVEALMLPAVSAGFWATMSMGAVFGTTVGSPLASIVFMLEVTHDVNILLPLLISVMVGYGVVVLALRRSIMTEKISRRGYHLSREYAVDPLEILKVRDVMNGDVIAISQESYRERLHELVRADSRLTQRLYPVVDDQERLVGVVTARGIRDLNAVEAPVAIDSMPPILSEPAVAFPDEPLRVVVERMADSGLTRLPVIDPDAQGRLAGMVSLSAVLKARSRNLDDERRRERFIPWRTETGLIRDLVDEAHTTTSR